MNGDRVRVRCKGVGGGEKVGTGIDLYNEKRLFLNKQTNETRTYLKKLGHWGHTLERNVHSDAGPFLSLSVPPG